MRTERSDVRREIDKLEWLEEKQGYLHETDAAAMKQLRAFDTEDIVMFDQKQSIDLPLIGRVTFDGNDVEKLYRYISEA